MKRIVWGLKYIVAAAAAALMIMLAWPNADIEVKAANGIDVSEWQGAVNWQQVRNSGVTFAMIRCGNTVYGLDSYFGYNMSQAAAAGLKTGVYCYSYAQNTAQAIVEAQFVINACANYTVSYPIAIDFEDSTLKGIPAAQQAAIVNAFCTTIYNAGYYPMVYSSRSWFVDRMGPVSWDHWVAQYSDTCTYPGVYTMWQYSSSGSVSGISGRVDMDRDLKNYAAAIPDHGWDSRNNNTYYIMNYRRAVGLQTIDGRLYYFDPSTAVLYSGWLSDAQGQKYYFDPNSRGAALVGWANIGGAMYYFDANAHAVAGGQTIDGARYLFNADNTMYVGWYEGGGVRTYYDPATGKLVLGWAAIGTSMYYFDPASGAATTGIRVIDGATYYFGQDGTMQVGMQNVGGKNYYFGADGAMQTGLIQIGSAFYYFGADGTMQTGIIPIGGRIYYFAADGTMQVGMQTINGAVYYFGADGAMQTGLTAIGSSFYYFSTDGIMQTGLTVVGSDFYYFASNGAMQVGWQTIGGGWFYFGADGKLVRNMVFYDNAGILVQVDVNGLLVAPTGYVPR